MKFENVTFTSGYYINIFPEYSQIQTDFFNIHTLEHISRTYEHWNRFPEHSYIENDFLNIHTLKPISLTFIHGKHAELQQIRNKSTQKFNESITIHKR